MSDPYVQGPLVMQTPEAAALAEIFVKAAERLWDAATEDETPAMWDTGREIASWVLSVCHRGLGEKAQRRTRQGTVAAAPPPAPSLSLAAPGAAAGSAVYLPGLQPVLADPG